MNKQNCVLKKTKPESSLVHQTFISRKTTCIVLGMYLYAVMAKIVAVSLQTVQLSVGKIVAIKMSGTCQQFLIKDENCNLCLS